MANCCSGETCYNLVTINDIESTINAASLDCTNYSSSSTINYDGCCGSEEYGSYSPNLSQLTANTGDVRFQNWSGGTNQFYKDKDGIVVINPNWETDACCSGITNVPLSNVNFKYAKFKSFSVNGSITSDACDSGTNGKASFDYQTERHEVNGCTSADTIVGTEKITDSALESTWGEIISAISINNGTWRNFSTYTDTTQGYITIPKANIFQPKFISSVSVSQGGECGGITASSEGNSVTVRIMPKFRGCSKNNNIGSYRAEKLSNFNGVFDWENTDTCETYISKEGSALTIGYYSGNLLPDSISVSPSSAATADFENGEITLNVFKNNDANDRTINVIVIFDICGTLYSSSCSFCQEPGIEIKTFGGNCATGLVTAFPSVTCGS